MSSACTCHTEEWCFYCAMYSPLERENEENKRKLRDMLNDIAEIITTLEFVQNDFTISRDQQDNKITFSMYNNIVKINGPFLNRLKAVKAKYETGHTRITANHEPNRRTE